MPTGVEAKNITVLICDDDPTYLVLMRDTLEVEGFTVIDAANGEIALSQYFTYQPDIVLLDVRMPITDGFEDVGKFAYTLRVRICRF